MINESDALKNSHSMMFTRALSVKSDVNGLLDIARATFLEYVDHLEEYVQVRGTVARSHLGNFRLNNSAKYRKIFWIVI